jgi:hypothetical protein
MVEKSSEKSLVNAFVKRVYFALLVRQAQKEHPCTNFIVNVPTL